MATGTTCALIVVVSTFAFAAGLHGETQDLPGDECNEPGCSQNAMQLRVLKRYTETATNDCQDLQDITEGVCKQEVAWARETGIQQHPEWYPGLSAQSSPLDFQCKVFQASQSKCPRPCGVACTPPTPPPKAAPTCAGVVSEKCLCVFDIDRTLTSKQGMQDKCPGSKDSDGIKDTAYGGGDLVLSQLAASGLSKTFCSKCYVGIVSHGDGSGPLSTERKELLEALNTDAMEHLVLRAWNAAWSDMKLMTPFYVAYPDALKQEAVLKILDWYASQEVCIQRENTYFFDDKDENILPFRGTGMNAQQISCQSRDPILGWGDVGLCGATQGELKADKGVSVCKIDCGWSEWSAWSGCSASCGGGQRSRNRGVIIKPRNGGKACGNGNEMEVGNHLLEVKIAMFDRPVQPPRLPRLPPPQPQRPQHPHPQRPQRPQRFRGILQQRPLSWNLLRMKLRMPNQPPSWNLLQKKLQMLNQTMRKAAARKLSNVPQRTESKQLWSCDC